jgi:hypothetical protein
MAHWAKVEDGIVTQVNVVEDDFLQANPDRYTGTWIKTSYNTQGGVHTLGGTPLNKNYAGIGYSWDGVGFAAPQPYPSWTKNSDTYLWEAPTPMPTDDKRYEWDEETTSWVEITNTLNNTSFTSPV